MRGGAEFCPHGLVHLKAPEGGWQCARCPERVPVGRVLPGCLKCNPTYGICMACFVEGPEKDPLGGNEPVGKNDPDPVPVAEKDPVPVAENDPSSVSVSVSHQRPPAVQQIEEEVGEREGVGGESRYSSCPHGITNLIATGGVGDCDKCGKGVNEGEYFAGCLKCDPIFGVCSSCFISALYELQRIEGGVSGLEGEVMREMEPSPVREIEGVNIPCSHGIMNLIATGGGWDCDKCGNGVNAGKYLAGCTKCEPTYGICLSCYISMVSEIQQREESTRRARTPDTQRRDKYSRSPTGRAQTSDEATGRARTPDTQPRVKYSRSPTRRARAPDTQRRDKYSRSPPRRAQTSEGARRAQTSEETRIAQTPSIQPRDKYPRRPLSSGRSLSSGKRLTADEFKRAWAAEKEEAVKREMDPSRFPYDTRWQRAIIPTLNRNFHVKWDTLKVMRCADPDPDPLPKPATSSTGIPPLVKGTDVFTSQSDLVEFLQREWAPNEYDIMAISLSPCHGGVDAENVHAPVKRLPDKLSLVNHVSIGQYTMATLGLALFYGGKNRIGYFAAYLKSALDRLISIGQEGEGVPMNHTNITFKDSSGCISPEGESFKYAMSLIMSAWDMDHMLLVNTNYDGIQNELDDYVSEWKHAADLRWRLHRISDAEHGRTTESWLINMNSDVEVNIYHSGEIYNDVQFSWEDVCKEAWGCMFAFTDKNGAERMVFLSIPKPQNTLSDLIDTSLNEVMSFIQSRNQQAYLMGYYCRELETFGRESHMSALRRNVSNDKSQPIDCFLKSFSKRNNGGDTKWNHLAETMRYKLEEDLRVETMIEFHNLMSRGGLVLSREHDLAVTNDKKKRTDPEFSGLTVSEHASEMEGLDPSFHGGYEYDFIMGLKGVTAPGQVNDITSLEWVSSDAPTVNSIKKGNYSTMERKKTHGRGTVIRRYRLTNIQEGTDETMLEWSDSGVVKGHLKLVSPFVKSVPNGIEFITEHPMDKHPDNRVIVDDVLAQSWIKACYELLSNKHD